MARVCFHLVWKVNCDWCFFRRNMLSIASTVPFCTWDKNNYVPLAHQTPLFQEKNWKVFCPPLALVFDCVWYHLCINAQHSSNPCEQMELCRSVIWFCKTAESSMPHLKFCLVCWLEKLLMTTTNKYKNLLWSVGNVKASPEWEKNWKFCC